MQDRIHQGQEKMQLLKLQRLQEEKKTSRSKTQDILQKMKALVFADLGEIVAMKNTTAFL